jgi:hypothetical protein
MEQSVAGIGLRRVFVRLAVIAATLLGIVDATTVNVVLPHIQKNFRISVFAPLAFLLDKLRPRRGATS